MNDVTNALKKGRSDDASQISRVRFVQKQTQIILQSQSNSNTNFIQIMSEQ